MIDPSLQTSSYAPRGVPAVSYVRVLTEGTQTTAENVEVDGSAVTVFSDNAPRSRHDGMQIVLPRGLSDVEAVSYTHLTLPTTRLV